MITFETPAFGQCRSVEILMKVFFVEILLRLHKDHRPHRLRCEHRDVRDVICKGRLVVATKLIADGLLADAELLVQRRIVI